MSFYIAFHNFSSFLKADDFADLSENTEAAIVDSSENAIQTVAAETEINILPEFESATENPVSVVDYEETIDALIPEISPFVEPNSEKFEIAAEQQNPAIEAENLPPSGNFEKFHSLLKKFEISLQYRYDFTDVFDADWKSKNSQNLDKSVEKNLTKQRAVQREDVEKRFQERRAENFREHLKHKRLANQLQNKGK